jgi:endogenous inhibitor of DNA gyrase (YacG/DUF329 family)
MPLKNCAVCGDEFMARLSVYKTCGTVCRNRLIAAEKEVRHTTTQPCIVCGKEFSNTGKQKHRKTCSAKCGYVVMRQAQQKQVARTCLTCGTGFTSEASREAKYCSHKCMYARNGTVYVTAVSKDGRTYLRLPPAEEVARNAKRRACQIQATPAWSSPALVLAFYEEAQRMSIETGTVHHVDHMVPLQSKHVCGLHTHSNLCVMVGSDNLSKSNRHWPDRP